MNWPNLELIEFGVFSGSENMAMDSHLLAICEENPNKAFLRFYGWSRWCISMGRFEPLETIDTSKAALDGVEVVTRPTGGRVVMHGDDLTYAIIMPLGTEGADAIYRQVCCCLLGGLRALGVEASFEKGHTGFDLRMRRPCFASASRHEITWKGKKLIGNAQRIGKNALLQHGSIPIGRGYLRIVEYMRFDEKERAALRQMMFERTCCLADILNPAGQWEIREIAETVTQGFAEYFDICNPAIDP
ncbi:MAG: lipoate--protein ligase family protein [bacterium]